MNEEKQKEIVEAYLQLGTYERVREKYGYSYSTIWKYIKCAGVNKGMGGNPVRVITDEQILSGIKQGLTRQEIADKYGTHVENLARRMKQLGVHARYAPNPVGKESLHTHTWHHTKNGERFIRERTDGRFEFVGYKEERYKLKCCRCGTLIEKSKTSILKNQNKCQICEQEKKERRKAEKQLYRTLLAIKEIKTPKNCFYCGEVFYSQSPAALYCSAKCKKKRKGTGIRERCKKYGVYYDSTVTAEKVFKRDRYRCQICGLDCIKGDTSWNGHFGAYSPTIDHIVALANGGTHTWDNVQCAHAICNSNKRDLITV